MFTIGSLSNVLFVLFIVSLQKNLYSFGFNIDVLIILSLSNVISVSNYNKIIVLARGKIDLFAFRIH